MSKEPEHPSEARKAELEALINKLHKEIDETSSAPAKLKLIARFKKLENEYTSYYND